MWSNLPMPDTTNNLTIKVGQTGPLIELRETDTTGTWEMSWVGPMGERHYRRALRAAEDTVLKNNGERIVLTCPPDEHALRNWLMQYPSSMLAIDDDTYTIEVICPAEDGLIHDDYDDRTPLPRITCQTCAERIAETRNRRRQEAFSKNLGPKEISKLTQRVAEAYTRLAEIEETLETPGSTHGG